MALYKRQNIQKLIVDQSGSERLILNDLIIGKDGAQMLSQLLPHYHVNLLHLEIKGNNIDSQGFEMVFMALMHCPGLISIQAQWNNIGSSASGLMALLYLVRNLRFLELVDLKNNKITHQHAEIIAEIIKTNNRSLKVLDFRWNEIGQIGAQIIYPSLAFNAALKSISLQDNRISSNSLVQISQYLKNVSRGTLNLTAEVRPLERSSIPQKYYPITDNQYPSMEVQMKTTQIRTKIDSQQQETILQQQKLQMQIQKAIQKIRVKGSQMHQAQLRLDALASENISLINNLREAERMLSIQKERFFGLQKNLNGQKSSVRAEKYQVSVQTQSMMEKTVQRQQKQMEDLNIVMNQKYDRLQSYLKDKLNDKRINRNKLADIKEDIIKFKLSKESAWDKAVLNSSIANKNVWQEECLALQDAIGKIEASIKSESKKGDYLSEQLTNFVMKGLRKQQKCQKEIFDIQNRIKQMHKDMTLANVEIEEKQCRIMLKQASTIQKEAAVDLNRRYIKYIHSQNSVNLDIERLKQDQNAKAQRFQTQTLDMRITDLQRAVRQQQSQNKMIRNHYQKILSQLEIASKNTIQAAIFQE